MRLTYTERRWQPLWLLAFGWLMTLSLGVAYWVAVSPLVGSITALMTTAFVSALWFRGRADIRVDASGLHVGRYFLEPHFIGEVEALETESFRQRTRAGIKANDVVSLANPAHGGVVIHNSDASDPFKQWVLGSRRPHQLAQALDALKSPHISG